MHALEFALSSKIMSFPLLDPSNSFKPHQLPNDDTVKHGTVAVLVRPVAPVLDSLRSRAYTRKVENGGNAGMQPPGAAAPATVSYQLALRAFQAGRGTVVRSNEQRHAALLVPRMDAASHIGIPAPGTSRHGLVGAQEMTVTPMMGRHGPIDGGGILFWSGKPTDEGSWQPVRADGTGVIIFSNASDEQLAAMQDKLASLSGNDANTSLDAIDALLGYAHSLGIHDCYQSTREAIGDRERFEVLASAGDGASDRSSLVRLIRKPVLTRALYVPPGSPLVWDIHGTPASNTIRRGAMIVVSRQAPLELRHIEATDAETYYRIADTGERVKLSSTDEPNVERLSAPGRRSDDALQPVRRTRVIGEVTVASQAGHTQEVALVNSREAETTKVALPGIFKPVPEDFHVVEQVSLPDAARWLQYMFGVMRERVDTLRGGAMVTLASVQGDQLTLAHAGDTRAIAFIQHARTGEVTAQSLLPDQSIDDYATLLKAFHRGVMVERRLGPAMHIDLESGQLFAVRDRIQRHVNDGMSTPHSVGGYATNPTRRKGQSGEPIIEQLDIGRLRREPGDRVFLWLSSDGMFDLHPARDDSATRGGIPPEAYASLLGSLVAQARESEFAARAIDHAIAQHSTDDKTVLVMELTASLERHLLMGVIDGHSGPSAASAICTALKEEVDRTRRHDPSQPAWAHSVDAPRPNPHYVSPYRKSRPPETGTA